MKLHSLQEVQLSENALKVLQRRCLLRDEQGNIKETPGQLFRRVAKAVAKAELVWGSDSEAREWEEKFVAIMSKLLFLPNSPTLMNAGTGNYQLSACFVLPVQDNMNSIFTTLKQTALIQQSGGGTGFNFSHLRPRNDFVTAGAGLASGPVSFMKIFDAATEQIRQGGKRRGANMGILNVDHPDIEEFIFSKKEQKALGNFNISVGITDDFMNAAKENKTWALIHPNSKRIVKTVRAKELWDKIVETAWQTGDPGLIFSDAINWGNPTPGAGKIESTNPCGEVPLLPYESCNLGSVNLSKVITQKNRKTEINWELLEEVVKIAVRFLDNVIEINNYIIPEIKSMTRANRKIGLGVMGWAELLFLLEIPYDSGEAVRLAEKLMSFISQKSAEASVELAGKRGVFPNWEKSIYYPRTRMRNATRTSIAPTGTISIIADTSPSIEPLFALAFRRQHVLNEETLISVNKLFIDYLRTHQLYSENIIQRVMKEGTVNKISEVPAEVKKIFKTALEILPDWHLKHQIAFQKYTDNAVAKTINLPESATINDVNEIYKTAWLHEAKGITVFRYGSKKNQVMYSGLESTTSACRVCLA